MTFSTTLTDSTEEQRKEMRRLFNVRVAHVNKAMRALYAERERIALELKEKESVEE